MREDLISYLITDPLYYTNNTKLFEKKLKESLSKKRVDIACFRDKKSKNFEDLAKIFVRVCKEFNIKKILINSDYEVANNLNANGVHLTSTQFDKIKKAQELKLFVIISCHNNEDIEKAKKLKVDAISYSPIFKTPNKGEEKGIEKLIQTLKSHEDLDIIALGGIIKQEQVEEISKTKACGFASIRYFI